MVTNYSNRPRWHLWRVQSWGQSCPLYRGGGGRHPHIHMANCQEGPPEWRWQTLNSIRFSKWQVTRYMKGNKDKALSFSKCSNIISWEAQVKSIPPCLRKRSREFNNLLKIAKPISDGAGTRIHSFWIPNIFYFSLGQVGLNGIPDPENWARAEGGMLQQTSLFGRTPSQQVFCQVAWCTRFPLNSVFELSLQKALQLLFSLVPSLSPPELSLLHCCSREERNKRWSSM